MDQWERHGHGIRLRSGSGRHACCWTTRPRTARNGRPSAIAPKIGCTAETLRKWARCVERDSGKRDGLTTSERERLKALERENLELKRANEILRKASAFLCPRAGAPARPPLRTSISKAAMSRPFCSRAVTPLSMIRGRGAMAHAARILAGECPAAACPRPPSAAISAAADGSSSSSLSQRIAEASEDGNCTRAPWMALSTHACSVVVHTPLGLGSPT